MDIILASSSPYKKELLSKLGISFRALNSSFDETLIKNNPSLTIKKKALSLSLEKAKSIFQANNQSLVIGADQICHLGDRIFSKSKNIEKSLEILKVLNGKTHTLTTAYAIVSNKETLTHINQTHLKMRCLSEKQLKNYLRKDNPIDCAGSYKLEMNGIALFEKIETVDYSAIVGLPLIQLGSDLEKLGVQIMA